MGLMIRQGRGVMLQNEAEGGSALIPTTNNTVELVIRRFDQHYQNLCGFDSPESDRLFLGVFENLRWPLEAAPNDVPNS